MHHFRRQISIILLLSAVASAQGLKRVRVNGYEFRYLEQGKGEPIVLVHGALCDYNVWMSVLVRLAADHRVIAYSRRGYWPNKVSGTSTEDNATQDASDLVSIIKELRLGKVHLVGHSAGGMVALLLARDHPELVRTLVIAEAGTPPLGNDERARLLAQALADMQHEVEGALQKGDKKAAADRVLTFVLGPEGYQAEPEEAKVMFMHNLPSLELAFRPNNASPRFTCKDAASISVPVLSLEGEESVPMMRARSDDLAACMPRLKRVKVPRAGHMLFYQAHNFVSQQILDFAGTRPR